MPLRFLSVSRVANGKVHTEPCVRVDASCLGFWRSSVSVIGASGVWRKDGRDVSRDSVEFPRRGDLQHRVYRMLGIFWRQGVVLENSQFG